MEMEEDLLNFSGFDQGDTMDDHLYPYLVPHHTRGAIERYLVHGLQPGAFLESVIKNNLLMAVGNADVANKKRLVDITTWFAQRAPLGSYGSPQAYKDWINDVNGERTHYAEELRKLKVLKILQTA